MWLHPWWQRLLGLNGLWPTTLRKKRWQRPSTSTCERQTWPRDLYKRIQEYVNHPSASTADEDRYCYQRNFHWHGCLWPRFRCHNAPFVITAEQHTNVDCASALLIDVTTMYIVWKKESFSTVCKSSRFRKIGMHEPPSRSRNSRSRVHQLITDDVDGGCFQESEMEILTIRDIDPEDEVEEEVARAGSRHYAKWTAGGLCKQITVDSRNQLLPDWEGTFGCCICYPPIRPVCSWTTRLNRIRPPTTADFNEETIERRSSKIAAHAARTAAIWFYSHLQKRRASFHCRYRLKSISSWILARVRCRWASVPVFVRKRMGENLFDTRKNRIVRRTHRPNTRADPWGPNLEGAAIHDINGLAFWHFNSKAAKPELRQDPLDLSVWSFLTFLNPGIEEVERHFLWNFYKKNSKEKLVKCATEVALLRKVSIQSCTQNRPSPKVQSLSRDWI